MADNIKITIDGENKSGNAFSSAERGMNDLHGAAGNLQAKALGPLNNMMGNVLKLSAGALAAGIGGLTAVIGSSVKASMDMEQQLADISASMGASADETSKLKKLINDLGFDPKLKVSATEAADAIGTLGTAGLSVDEILGGAARSTVLLANATGADFADAAAIATDVMAQFNIKAEDMASAVNGITSTTIASKFDINDYKLALAQAGGVAATVGVEFDDFNTTIAAISPYFASGSDAGTSFKTFLQRLVPSSNEATDAMRDLGLFTGLTKQEFNDTQDKIQKVQAQIAALDPTAKNYTARAAELNDKLGVMRMSLVEGSNAFFDQNGKMKSMAEISGILNNALGGLSEEQKIATLSTIFGSDAMRAAASIAGMTEEQFLALKDTMAKTDAEESAAKRMDTLSGVMEILWGVIDSLKLQIGDAFLPVLRVMAENFTQQATVYGPRIVEMFRLFAEQLSAVIQYLVAVVTDGDRANDWLTHMTPEVRNAVLATLDFVDSLKATVDNITTFIDKIGGVQTILKAFGVLLAISVVAQVVTFIAGIVSAVGAVVSFTGALGGAMVAAGGFVASLLPILGPIALIGAAVYGLKVAWDNNFLGIQDKTKVVFDWLKETFTNFPDTIAGVKDKFSEWGTGAMGKLREGFLAAKDWVRNGLDQVMDFVQQGRDQRLGPFAQSLYDMGNSAFTKLGQGFSAAGGMVSGEFNRVMTDVQNQGAAFAGGAFAGRLYEAARSAMLRFSEGLRSAAPNLGSDMANVLTGMTNVFNGTMDGFRNHVWAVMVDVGNRIKGALGSVNLGGIMNGAIYGIIDEFNKIMDSFRNHVWSVMSGIGGRIGDGLAAGIRDSMGAVSSALNWITSVAPQWVRDALGIHSPSTVFADIGSNIMAGLAEGIAGATAMPEMALAGATGGMMAAPTNNVSRTVNNNYSITNQGTTGSGDPIEQVRALRSAYGGTR